MIASATRRLPGFRFEVQTPTPAEVLPRMDIAVLVGFAASGPLNRPVAVEDVAQFESIFGVDAPLAWDAERGEMVSAYLAPAVRAFFRNGGQRCWVIRVAREDTPQDASPAPPQPAQSNYFPIPGLMRAAFDDNGNLSQLTPAFAVARSEGSWSDGLWVGAALLSATVVVNDVSLDPLQFTLALNSLDDLAVGDLLRLTFRQQGYQLVCVVDSITPVDASPSGVFTQVLVTGAKPVWLQESWAKFPTTDSGQAYTFAHTGPGAPTLATVPLAQGGPPSPPSRFDWPNSEQAQTVSINLSEGLEAAPAPGTLVKLALGGDEFWMAAGEFHAAEGTGSPPSLAVQLTGEGLWHLASAPASVSTMTPDGERLTFELWTRLGETDLQNLTGLGFETRHPSFWGALPTDLQLYPDIGVPPDTSRADLWQAAAVPRFPLAGLDEANVLYFPIAMPLIPDTFLSADPVSLTSLERDGLSLFDASLFLDEAFDDVGVLDLLSTADFIRYTSPNSRPLCGIHAALAVDEATLIAVPDAIHRGWSKKDVPPVPAPFASPPLPRPSWWHYLDCKPDPNQPPPLPPDSTSFPGAYSGILSPELERQDRADLPGVVVLTWRLFEAGQATFVLEESARPDFSQPQSTYSGAEQKALIYGLLPGDYYFHVRATVDGQNSDWSNALVVRVPVGTVPLAAEPPWGEFLDCPLIIVQAPVLYQPDSETGGTFTLRWDSPVGETFILEEALARDFAGAVVVYTGTDSERTLYGRTPGEYFYRVRAVVKDVSSDWSNGIGVRVSPPAQWVLDPIEGYSPGDLLKLQRGLVRMCAASSELFAVLAMPEHYRENAAIAHVPFLLSPTLDAVGPDDTRTFSFGALYHPWLFAQDTTATDLRRVPPDGAACGILAQRAFYRGAWIAPANEQLTGVVALDPPMKRERWLDLQIAQINIVRQEPRGFLTLSADTLSGDEDVRPINVRRLLTLLRRMALKLGATYVFEPNSDSFRRRVTRGFQDLLGKMFERGAFAGNTRATSFQVVTDSSVNTPESIDQGRFIVELRVAPSLPLTFVTIRLVQTGDRSTVAEVS